MNKDDVQQMTRQLREGIVAHKPIPVLRGEVECDEVECDEVECDEVYVVAGHKGHPKAVLKKGAADGDGGSKERVGAAPKRVRNHRSWA